MKWPNINSPLETVIQPTRESSHFGGLMILSVIASTTAILFLLSPGVGWTFRISLTAFILITLRYSGGALVLMAVQTSLFLREPPRSEAFDGLTGVVTVFLILGLLMFINRHRDLLHRAASRPYGWVFPGVATVFRGDTAFGARKAVQEIPGILGATIRGIAVLMSCVFVSRIVLSTLPTRRTLNNELQTWMMNEDSVLRCSLLFGTMIAVWIVCNEISWRQLTRGQAQLYLRSVFLTTHHADLRMIVRRRLKLRRKAARGQSNQKTPSGVLNEKYYAGNEK